MGWAIAGVVVNLFALLGGISNLMSDTSDSFALILGTIMGAFWVASLVGLFVASAGKRKLGGILIIVGSVVFVPIGLIGMFGGRKVMQIGTSDLDARRLAAESSKSQFSAEDQQ